MLTFARSFLRKLRKKRFFYKSLIEVKISREAILHNLRTFQNLNKKVSVAPVLKSNAYGHGLVEVANIVDGENISFICVDSYFEALILRNEGIRSPILIIGYTPLENIIGNQLKNVAFGIISLDGLREISQNIRTSTIVHLKIDTGMHRHGILTSEVDEALSLIRANKRIVLEGIYSHLADADTANSPHAAKQISMWNEIVQKIRNSCSALRYSHLAATPGSFYAENIDANTTRLGLGLYGINASLAPLILRPALEMTTRITSLRTIERGESIGYNATFTTSRKMRAATIPVGYNEGVNRRLSNNGSVLIRGTACPIVGRVSMNITSIDVSNVADIALDEGVTVISSNAQDPNSVEKIARACDTIPYDILVHIPAHLRRVVV